MLRLTDPSHALLPPAMLDSSCTLLLLATSFPTRHAWPFTSSRPDAPPASWIMCLPTFGFPVPTRPHSTLDHCLTVRRRLSHPVPGLAASWNDRPSPCVSSLPAVTSSLGAWKCSFGFCLLGRLQCLSSKIFAKFQVRTINWNGLNLYI